MMQYHMKHLRNIGIMAHIDAGKTTATERILYFTGLTHKIGEVHNGNTVMDWMSQEQERGITITSAATSCHWKDHKINIIDTPGHVDFTVEVERCLRILDGAIFLLDAKEGVEAQTKVVWSQAKAYHVPRLIFINKMDTIGADFNRSLNSIETELGIVSLPIQMPIIDTERDFKGVISLVTMKAYYNTGDFGEQIETRDIPSQYIEEATNLRQQLLENLSDYNDELMTHYLDGLEIEEQLINDTLRTATISGEIVPVLCGSAYKNKGIQLLLDAVVNYLPSPLDSPVISGTNSSEQIVVRKPDYDQPFSALIFKVMTDPYVGRLTYFRIYSGHVSVGGSVLNVSQRKKVRINKLLQMHANNRSEIDYAEAGDIVAAIGLKFTGTGNTLSDLSHPILLESIDFPEPVISMAIEPKRPSDHDKLFDVLKALSEEDPTLLAEVNQGTGQTLLSGMGELHLEIAIDRLSKEFGLDVNTGKPRVTYKETIKEPVTIAYKLDQLLGTDGVFACVTLKVTPKERGSGNTISSTIKGNKIPKTYIEAAIEGVRRSLQSGIIEGYEVIDLDIVITEMTLDEQQSSDVAFMTAAAYGLTEALHKGKSILLEPYFTVTIHVSDDYIGDIMDDVQRRKGTIIHMASIEKDHKLKAIMPLSKLFGYATDIRSITHGTSHYTMIFSHYDPIV